MELRLFCMPELAQLAQKPIGRDHLSLAAQVSELSRALLRQVFDFHLRISFQSLLSSQPQSTRQTTSAWARANNVLLLDVHAQPASLERLQ